MKLFLVEALGAIEWGNFDSAVVVAQSAKHAERRVRVDVERIGSDRAIRSTKLKVTEIKTDDEQIVLMAFGEESRSFTRE